jgi:hypothetical protein
MSGNPTNQELPATPKPDGDQPVGSLLKTIELAQDRATDSK